MDSLDDKDDTYTKKYNIVQNYKKNYSLLQKKCSDYEPWDS